MLFEAFCAVARYVIVPGMRQNACYATYDFSGMTRAEIDVWRLATTVPRIRKAHAATPAAYLAALQDLGIRAALSGTDACVALRIEYNSKPMLRRLK